ncbi:MAG: winged helix-turn-helix transcriptional regulator [Nanoarchaeota archaeon]|nr:winged helix-turn-helix transcriptional regulator [DPANN group archaeon]MBL7117062.1 winged helix-turn-helix transcriptional regulator [Nanoarchaeota archaeon]
MLQKYNKYRLLRVFFEDPLPKGIGFQLRELSRKIDLAPTSVKKYLNELEKEGLITKEKHRIHSYPVYYANREDENFKFLKELDIIMMIKKSGLLEYLEGRCMPDVIILFGSASRGEDVKGSDVDLFLLCKERRLDLKKYELRLSRKISVFFCENFNNLSKELRNNIINGVLLKGYLKVF